ncbi:hypothetical protein RHCRD62_110110 [Rhodococcus sp. RD6.2]|nr:hypothetical protein RHCRD62_110110 [Rhodococcus sp. RD6.2]
MNYVPRAVSPAQSIPYGTDNLDRSLAGRNRT